MVIDLDHIHNHFNSNIKKINQKPIQVWINVGVPVETDEGTKFVSLPLGIPLDPLNPVSTNSKNEDFRAFQMARNDLLDQLKKHAARLRPGEEVFLPLSVQMRRIEDPNDKPIPNNPYKIELNLD